MSTSDTVYFLLVDDLEENLLALEALLRRDGLELLKARSGPEALELLLIHDMALALIDVQMPAMDGFELAELIRGTERTRRVPIIFLTAGSDDPQRHFRGYEAGAVDFIRKPIEPDILRSKAGVFFELYRQRQDVSRQRDELRVATKENSRLLEESREADRRKDEFLATLAHELRNPLAPIRSAVDLMRAQGLDDPKLEWARQVIDRQVTNMSRLVDELLDVSRIATGKIVLRRERVELATVIDRAIEASQQLIEAKSHNLESVLPPEPIILYADEIRLSQVFANLLTNAAKYTDPKGCVRIVGQRIGGDVEVSVEDTGVGIDEDMLGKVFDLFTQIAPTTERSKGGLGVGLALVRKLVELHGGIVFAESAGPGRGSKFTVRLPMSRYGGFAGPEANAENQDKPSSERTKRRILVVDDNADGAMSLALLMKAMGHETVAAYSGPDGLEAARMFRPDLAFLDIGLPGMSGYDLCRAIRSDPSIANTKLVALTGWGTEEDKRRAAEAGFDSHLTKPADSVSVNKILANFAVEEQ